MSDNKQPQSFFDKNTIMAMVLSFAVFLAWNSYMEKKYPKKKPEAGSAQTIAPSGPQTNSGEVKNPNAPTPTEKAQQLAKGDRLDSVQELTQKFDSDTVSLEISSKGMGFKNLILKQYTDRKNEPVTYRQDQLQTLGATTVNDSIDYAITQTGPNEFKGELMGIVQNGYSVKKTITIDPKKYLAHTTIQVTSAEKKPLHVKTYVQGTVDEVKSSMFMANYEHQEFFALDTEKKHRNKLVNSKSLKETYENGRIAAFNSQYFALALMNRSDLLPRIEGGNEGPIGGFTFSWETPQPVDQQSFSYDFYFGPKQVDMLRSVDDELTLLIDLGKFSFIGKPLSWAMRAIHGFVFNWGIAIILLTIILRSALAPLALYSMRSMKKMQAIQPKLNAIKEKYKADPARVNQETLALMKSEKANPLSGCLPMLLQIPVFFAIYAMIGSSFELYKEPFFFWIHDLTLKDPYFILPVLGSLVFFVQQRMMPPSPGMDPTQQKMMMFLPLFMTAFMLGMPAGLSLYYFINALCGLAQQLAFMRERTT